MWAKTLVDVPAASRSPPGPTSPVDVPAALWECWGQGHDPRAGTPPTRATDPSTGGHQPKNWSFCQAPPCCNFFNLAGALTCFFHQAWAFMERWYVFGQLLRSPTACRRSWAILAGLFHADFLGTVVFPVSYPVFHSRRLYRLCLSLVLSFLSRVFPGLRTSARTVIEFQNLSILYARILGVERVARACF